MGYGALSAANYFDSTGYTANPKVYSFKWGRNGWNSTATSYTGANPVGTPATTTPPDYTITSQYVSTTTTPLCTGATATSAGVSGLVGCVGFKTIAPAGSASSGIAPWVLANDGNYRPIDIRPSPTEFIMTHTTTAATWPIELKDLFDKDAGGADNYGNLKKLNQGFNGTNKYVLYNRTQHTGLIAAMGARMLGYDAVSFTAGLRGWNSGRGEGKGAKSVGALMTSTPVGSIFAGRISTLHATGTSLNTAPTITVAPIATPGYYSATITWSTDYPATTQITDKDTYNDTVLATSHSATLTGLTPGTTYAYKAISYDCVANKVESSESSFTTVVSTASGNGYNYPSPGFRASLALNVTGGPSSGSGTLKFYYTKTRVACNSSSISSVVASGNTATVTGTCVGGATFTATVSDAPEKMGITLSTGHTQSLADVTGNYTVSGGL